jgi:hypothetical protein
MSSSASSVGLAYGRDADPPDFRAVFGNAQSVLCSSSFVSESVYLKRIQDPQLGPARVVGLRRYSNCVNCVVDMPSTGKMWNNRSGIAMSPLRRRDLLVEIVFNECNMSTLARYSI